MFHIIFNSKGIANLNIASCFAVFLEEDFCYLLKYKNNYSQLKAMQRMFEWILAVKLVDNMTKIPLI